MKLTMTDIIKKTSVLRTMKVNKLNIQITVNGRDEIQIILNVDISHMFIWK